MTDQPVLAVLLAAASGFVAIYAADPAPSAAPSPAASLSADRVVQRIADRYASESKGTIAVRSHDVLSVDAPMNRRTTASDEWYVLSDGELRASSEKQDARRPLVHDPVRSTWLAEYRYDFAPCDACAPGQLAIAYSSRTADAYHAHGTLVVDASAERVVRNTEIPYALPWPTKHGVIAITWAQASIGWFPSEIDGVFDGKVGPFSGTAHFSQRLAPYARFPSDDAAIAALAAATGKAAQTVVSPAPASPRPADRTSAAAPRGRRPDRPQTPERAA